MATWEDDFTRVLGDDVLDSKELNEWTLFADWLESDNQPVLDDLSFTELLKQPAPKYSNGNGNISDPKEEEDSSNVKDLLTPAVPSCSVSPKMPQDYPEEQPLIFQTKYPPKYKEDPHFKMEAEMFPPTRPVQQIHQQQQHQQQQNVQMQQQPQQQNFTEYPGQYSNQGTRPLQYQQNYQYVPQQMYYSQYQNPGQLQQQVPQFQEDFKFTPSQPFYDMSFSQSDNGQKVKIQQLPDYYGVQPPTYVHNPFISQQSPANVTSFTLPQQRSNGNVYSRNYDQYFSSSAPPHQQVQQIHQQEQQQRRTNPPPMKSISKKPSILNSKGKRKTDHELREEFYRREFRLQTGGKDPPRFTPSRSAFDESFKWRPTVNEEYGINIPIYRRLNGKLDSPTTCSRSGRRVRKPDPKPPNPPTIPDSWKGKTYFNNY